MISEGQKAPDFALPGVEAGRPDVYELHRAVGEGAVLLWFFPATFLPTATAELCAIRDAGWHELSGLEVWGISMDSIYAASAYAREYDLPMVLLGDGDSAADYYGVRYEEWEGHYGPPKRAVFLVGDDWTVEFAWVEDDAFARSDPSPLVGLRDHLAASFPDAETDITIEYDAYFG